MTDLPESSELDVLSPELQMALRARQSGPRTRTDTATEAELAAMALMSKRAGSARQMRAKLRKELRASIARFQRASPVPDLPVPSYYGPPVRCGFDAEWVTLPDGRGGLRNEVLCVTAVVGCGGKRTRFIDYAKGPSREHRPTMAGFLQRAIRLALREGTVPSMPAEIIVFGHFIRGDLASFSDFWAHKRAFRGLGRTLVSRPSGHVLGMSAAPGPVGGSAEAPDADDAEGRHAGAHTVHLRALDGRQFAVRVRFVDTIKLTPGQKGLAYAARMVGRKKLDLHADLGVPAAEARERPECAGLGLLARYGKERMDLIMRDFPEQFERYAIEDADIALDYGVWIERMALDGAQFGLKRLPNSLAGMASALVRDLSGGRAALDALVGRQARTESYFSKAKRTYRTIRRDALAPGLEIYYQLATNVYHGGRNECFCHGPTAVGMWYDFDLPGAYTTALVALRPVDYDGIRQEHDPDAYGIDDMGVAWVTFEFPAHTRFPCLPVRGEMGALFFPFCGRKEDRVFVCAPEIVQARRMGGRVTVIHGLKVPWKSDHRIFEGFTRLVQSKRREFPKKDHPALNELWKEVGNSGYGLTAQGLKAKVVFDPETMGSKPMGYSPLTEPFQAAWATSLIRAVLSEILAGVPSSGTVVSATTDGLLTDVPLAGLRLDGPLCGYFAAIRERLFGAAEILELKHCVRQLVSVAVRTTFTALKADGHDLVCAKGSVKPPTANPILQNRHMLRLYLKQCPGMKVAHEQLISAREQLTRESDLYGLKRERTLNLRYDLKRKPIDPRMVRLGRRTTRIAWETVPWRTVTEAEFARNRLDDWTRGRQRLLKTMADYRDWEAYFEASWAVEEAHEAAGLKRKTIQVRDDNAAGVLKRVFLQAGRRDAWGLSFEPRSLVKVAAILDAAGYPTSKEDLTFAARRKAPLLEHCVPWVPETEALLRVILQHFPDFDYARAFRPRDDSPRWTSQLDTEEIAG